MIKMIDVGSKPATRREATAIGEIHLKPDVIDLIKENQVPKGNVLSASRIAGILGAKKTDEIIPLCHPLNLENVEVSFFFEKDLIRIRSRVAAEGKTGVEMEALTAVSIAALTIYDMCKPLNKEIVIGPIYLAKKTGGKSGEYRNSQIPEKWLGESEWL